MEKTVDAKTIELKHLISCSVVIPRSLPFLADRNRFSGLCVELVTRKDGDRVEGTDLKFETPELAVAFAEIVKGIMDLSKSKQR